MSPRRTFRRAGVAGVLVGVILSLIAWWVPTVLASLALFSVDAWESPWPARLFLLGLGLIVVLEIPLMLFVLVKLARSGRQGGLLSLTHLAYVGFPGVYALLGTLLTAERWWAWMMVFLVGMRFVLSVLAVPSQIEEPATE